MNANTSLYSQTLLRTARILAPIAIALFALPPVKATPIQSSARPFGLEIAGVVEEADSDASSSVFFADVLPDFQQWANENLSEAKRVDDSRFPLDASKLLMSQPVDNLRIYFIGEGAGYHNSLGINLSGKGLSTGNPLLVFPDASVSPSGKRKQNFPLQPGDFVDVGDVEKGAFLNFFLIANGANGGSRIWSMDNDSNSDGINHVVSYSFEESPYLLIGFEDLPGGGDRDFNDLVFAVDAGVENTSSMLKANVADFAVPDKGSTLTLLGIALFAVIGIGYARVWHETVERA